MDQIEAGGVVTASTVNHAQGQGLLSQTLIYFLHRGAGVDLLKKRTSNIERPTSNLEWENRIFEDK